MNYKIGILIFLIIFLLQVNYDYILHKCKNRLGKILILVHHIINLYLILGSILFENHLIHLIVLIIGLFTHKILGKCILTIYTNKLCLDKKDKHKPLITLLNHIIGVYDQDSIKNLYYSILILIIIYDLYFINKKYKIIKL